MSLDTLARVLNDNRRLERLERCKRDLWFLCTEYLGFTLLTEKFHKPMMDEMDRRRLLRMSGDFVLDEFEAWPRDHFKTTVRKGQVIQDLMWNPLTTIVWWHNVEDRALEAGGEIVSLLQKNKKLRELAPDICPFVKAKAFSNGAFATPANKREFNLAASIRCFGWSSEATGGHAVIGYLDDIIGFNTLLDNLMPKVRRWLGITVRNVIRTGSYLRATGTRYDEFDVYADWIKSPLWACTIRAALETDGKPDINGQPTLYTRAEIERKRQGMTEWEFWSQMMNDPRPSEELLWKGSASEHTVSIKDIAKFKGTVFIINDPAPANVGSFGARDEKSRADGTKNVWAIAAVKIQVNGERQEIVLLDLDGSKDWSTDEGYERSCLMAKKWATPFIAYEATSSGLSEVEKVIANAARKVGMRGVMPVKLESTYAGKPARFAALASKALRQEFLMLDSLPSDHLETFLNQCRTWRVLGGRVTIPFDDYADVVSYGTDGALQKFAPQPAYTPDPMENEWGEEELSLPRSRYCGT